MQVLSRSQRQRNEECIEESCSGRPRKPADPRGCTAEENAEVQDQGDSARTGKMLSDKELHGSVEMFQLVDVAPTRALSLIMDNLGSVDIVHFEARLCHPVAPIEVLPIHKEGFIQSPHCFKDLASHHHKRTAHRIDRICLILIQKGQVVFSEKP